jgi:hypothetical protein
MFRLPFFSRLAQRPALRTPLLNSAPRLRPAATHRRAFSTRTAPVHQQFRYVRFNQPQGYKRPGLDPNSWDTRTRVVAALFAAGGVYYVAQCVVSYSYGCCATNLAAP